MNKNQKRILVAVLAIIVGMLAYPPFQVVARNGVVFNMGYGWIADPPKRGYITATVNVAMLLIQWIGVLVVGGLAFLLTKSVQRESDAPSSNPQNESHSTVQSPPAYSSYSEANAPRNPDEFYKAIVGPKNQDYYLRHFSRFDSTGKVGVSWHWPAFFVSFYWFLYRKMWLNALIYFFLPYLLMIPMVIVVPLAGDYVETIIGIGYALYLAGMFLLLPMYANALYYKHCKKKISEASASSPDLQRQIGELSAKGGTSGVALIVVLVVAFLALIGILAAIAIPQFQGYKNRARLAGAETSAGYQQPSEAPHLQQSPDLSHYSDEEFKKIAGIKDNEFGKGNGKLSIFTEHEHGTTDVSVDGIFIGQLNSYFPAGTSDPACGQDGTVSKIFEAGSHRLLAKNSDGTYWETTINIREGECLSQPLQKPSNDAKTVGTTQVSVPQNQAKAKEHFERGVNYSLKKEYDKAIAEYLESLRYNPNVAAAHSNLAFAYFDKGNLDSAIQEHKKTIEIDPANSNAYYGMALIYENMGNKTEAIKSWQEFIRLTEPHSLWWNKAQERLEKLKGN